TGAMKSCRIDLPRLDLDRHRTAEDRQLDADADRVFRLLRFEDLFDLALHPLEGAVPHADAVSLVELELDLLDRPAFGVAARGDRLVGEHAVHLVRRHRARRAIDGRPDEIADAGRLAEEV